MNYKSDYGIKKKIVISILSGILCFLFSHLGIEARVGQIDIRIPWSLIFPIITAIVFGSRFGFIAGLAGGAYFPFLLWPNNGIPNVTTAFVYLGVYSLFGLLRDESFWSKQKKDYVRTITAITLCIAIFAIYYSLLFNPLLSFNPLIGFNKSIIGLPADVLYSFIIKESINLILLSFVALTLLELAWVRKVLGMQYTPATKSNNKILVYTILVAVTIWLMLVGLGHSLLQADNAFKNQQLILVLFVIVVAGFIVARVLFQYNESKLNTENELKLAKEKAEESENRLKLATKSGQLGVWDWNVKDNVMIWDERMFVLYGITSNTFSNNLDAWTGGLHPEDKQWAIDECNQALNGEKDFNTSFRIVQRNGTIKYLKADGIVIRDIENNPIRMIGINKDITERKQAEKALQESEGKYKNLVETSSDAIYLVSADGTIIDANQASSAMLGRSKEEIIGSMIDSVDQNYPIDEFLKFWNGIPFDEQYIFETTHLRKDGTLVPIEISGKKFKQYENVFYYGIGRDITDRKNKEMEIQKKIENLQWYYDISISRELKMAVLKKEINALTDRLGEVRRYM